jgi:hypothetical protein
MIAESETYPNEIMFYERAIFAWDWNLIPYKSPFKNMRTKPSTPDMFLSDYHGIAVEIKATDKVFGKVDYSNIGENVKDKVAKSRKPGRVPITNFIIDLGENRVTPATFPKYLEEMALRLQVERVWVADAYGLHRIF